MSRKLITVVPFNSWEQAHKSIIDVVRQLQQAIPEGTSTTTVSSVAQVAPQVKTITVGGGAGGISPSNISSAGGVVFVASPNVLTEDATHLWWDATNTRLNSINEKLTGTLTSSVVLFSTATGTSEVVSGLLTVGTVTSSGTITAGDFKGPGIDLTGTGSSFTAGAVLPLSTATGTITLAPLTGTGTQGKIVVVGGVVVSFVNPN